MFISFSEMKTAHKQWWGWCTPNLIIITTSDSFVIYSSDMLLNPWTQYWIMQTVFMLLCLHNSCEIDLYMHGVLLILYDKVCAWVHLYGLLKIDSGLNSTYTTFLYTHWMFQTPWGIQ